jgi:hypothetical protein
MSAARDVLWDLKAIGATIEPMGDHLLLHAGPKSVPASIIRRVRKAKPELLVMLYQNAAAMTNFVRVVPDASEPSLEQPCAARRGRVQESDGAFLHFRCQCGRFAAFGFAVNLRAGRVGRWYCGEHRPLQ